MNAIRLGIVGMGNIGRYHADYLLKGDVPRCELVAAASGNPATAERYPSLRIFADGAALIRSGAVDAVLIATPHYQHATMGQLAFEAGLHAMVEKPIAAHKADAERLIEAHRRHPKLVFGGMFQLRVEPRYLAIQRLIAEELGRLTRINWINTDWYRTDVYFASGAWRATWRGEGGGVLLNQCLHNLDVLQWLCGMPQRVRGFCGFGRFHPIEVEDDVTAYFQWPGGATGTFVSTTGESPGTNRLEIAGTRGKLVLEHDRLTLTRNDADAIEFSRTAAHGFTKPGSSTADVPFANADRPHAIMMRNFVAAILDGEPLIAPGEEGINSVELANATVFSSLLGQTLELPMDASAWERRLHQLIAESKVAEKKVVTIGTDDFAASFRK
jgi:predicted dehydrogenase